MSISKKRNLKGLSHLQRSIIAIAEKNGGTVLVRDVLIQYFGFKPLRNPDGVRPGATLFSKRDIGYKMYNARTVSVCKAFSRLVGRGLAMRILSGINLVG